MPQPQSFKSHARTDPPFHFFVLPALLLNFIASIYYTVHHWPSQWHLHFWWIVMSVVLLLAAERSRSFALKAQDRIIRLEERLRLMALLPTADQSVISSLSERQLIGLRFASDVELPALAIRAAKEKLSNKEIKALITNWRADEFRV